MSYQELNNNKKDVKNKIININNKIICDDCNKEYDMYMIKNPIWLYACRADHEKWALLYHEFDGWSIFTTFTNYCIDCVEKRIGRKITKEDLTDAPVNEEIVKKMSI